MYSPWVLLSVCSVSFYLPNIVVAEDRTIWDHAPDFSRDSIQPYPSLKNSDGSNITIENLRGARLFGWKGCSTDEANAIGVAYNDFYKLANQYGVYDKIDWNDQATIDFFGPNGQVYNIPESRREQIQQVFAALQQVYTHWWNFAPGPFWWIAIWIEVRCSGGDGTGDPENVCGDRDNPAECPAPGGAPIGGKRRLEAYSDPTERYSRITFCTEFFNLLSMGEAIKAAKKLPTYQQNNLEVWNNRARVFFHEVTHLDYFVNAPGKSPYISDTQFRYKDKGETFDVEGYGPYNAKILRNYIKKGRVGYYTQRNADSYAWFALAKYVQGQIKKYPSGPNPGKIEPMRPPRDNLGQPLAAEDTGSEVPGEGTDLIEAEELGPDSQHAPGFSVPGCGDKFGKGRLIGASEESTTEDQQPSPDPLCDLNALSGFPFNVFSGPARSVYDKFCAAVENDQNQKLTWLVGANGEQKSAAHRLRTRTPPVDSDPEGYPSYTIELIWQPNTAPNECNKICKDAYATIATSPCGHQGGTQNGMTATGSIGVGCGKYSYKITGERVPEPQEPLQPTLSKQYCYPANAFGDHGDIDPDWQSEYMGYACAGTAETIIKKDDLNTRINWHTETNGVAYNYTIAWMPNCESAVSEMNVWKPLVDNSATCESLLRDDFEKCATNGGIGGRRSAGCVLYEFKASNDAVPE
ncbi:MAG: hypothetical protein Q9213_000480 [Squamulea squamosa]